MNLLHSFWPRPLRSNPESPEVVLGTLNRILIDGETIPLAWIMMYGDRLESAWQESNDPETMIRIAAHVVSPQQLFLATEACVRTAAINKTKSDSYALKLLSIAKRWALGRANVEDVERAQDELWESRAWTLSGHLARAANMAAEIALGGGSGGGVGYSASLAINETELSIKFYNGNSVSGRLADIVRSKIPLTAITVRNFITAARRQVAA